MVIQIDIRRAIGGRPPWALYLPGIVLVTLGLLIVFMPSIVRWLIGGMCIAAGAALLLAPSRLR